MNKDMRYSILPNVHISQNGHRRKNWKGLSKLAKDSKSYSVSGQRRPKFGHDKISYKI